CAMNVGTRHRHCNPFFILKIIVIIVLHDDKIVFLRMLYVTPHHQYPTTVTLSPQRRIDLLKLAEEYNFIIVEDDYDYDFQYEKGIAMPMASADIHGTVIYIGTFGRSLAPPFRT